MTESDFEVLGHVIADHWRAVVALRARIAELEQENAALKAENAQLRDKPTT